ncbi:MAG: twin-arginine translocase subunit TatC, partial [Phycisphaeraceae bacterium]|nr:twin-arginine translocase subunit TatC [Phycisphaeraceae bacterium]
LPLVMMFIMYTGLLTPKTLGKYRRHFIVGAVADLAVLTPTGDPVTLIIVSIPVILLYEVGLILGRMTIRKKAKRAAKEEEANA